MDHDSINYNNTAQLTHYNWNRLLVVTTKLLPFKNNNYIHVRQVCKFKTSTFSINVIHVIMNINPLYFSNRITIFVFSMGELHNLSN